MNWKITVKYFIIWELIIISFIVNSNLAIESRTDYRFSELPRENQITTTTKTNPLDKIDEKLIPKLINKSSQDEWVQLIIVYNNSTDLSVKLPENVKVLSSYNLFKGQLIKTQIKEILHIAQIPEIKSIWWDIPHNNTQEMENRKQEIIKSALSDFDPSFVNYTDEVKAPDLWARGYDGSGIVIAVLDTGVDITGSAGGDLDDFDGQKNQTKFLGGVSMVPDEPLYYTDLNGRGTFHTGIACGTGNLNQSYIGIAPGAFYLNVKIYDSLGITYWSFIISGIEWAIAHGADILLFPHTIPGLYIDPVSQAVNTATERGILVVTPVGDDGPSYMSVNTPGQATKACTVGAYNSHTKSVWEFSSRGPTFDFGVGPDLIAPGVDLIGPRSRIFTIDSLDAIQNMAQGTGVPEETIDLFWESYQNEIDSLQSISQAIPKTTYGRPLSEDSNYTKSTGTGAAAAVVAGAAAILLQAFPLANPSIIQQAMMESARSILSEKDLNIEGAGLIDIQSAYNWLTQYFIPNTDNIQPSTSSLFYSGLITNRNTSIYGEASHPVNYTSNPQNQDVSAIFSTQAMMDALLVSNSSISSDPNLNSENLSFILLPLNQFGIQYSLSNNPATKEFHWFSEFDVIREMHQSINYIFYEENYRRYTGLLELNGLYTVVIVETWSYCGDYEEELDTLNITNPLDNETLSTNFEYNPLINASRVNSFKISFQFINNRPDQVSFENLSLISYFKADMFLNENENLNSGEIQPNQLLNFTYDDSIYYNALHQTTFVGDFNNNSHYVYENNYSTLGFQSLTHNLTKYTITESLSLLANLTLNPEDNIPWNMTIGADNEKQGNGYSDLGFANFYTLGNVLPNEYLEFKSVISVGLGKSLMEATSDMLNQTYYIKHNVTQYPIIDLMVISSNFSRIIEKDQKWTSTVKIINTGNQLITDSELAFIVNRSTTQSDVYEIFSIVYQLHNFAPFTIKSFSASWVPLNTGIYSIGWFVGDMNQIYASLNMFYGSTDFEYPGNQNPTDLDVDILNNLLIRNIYVVDGQYYDSIKEDMFLGFPFSLDQKPMTIYAPLDYAIYNITILTSYKFENVKISTDGIGKNLLFFLQPDSNGDSPLQFSNSITRDLSPYSAIPLFLFGNPFIPPGKIQFNITFTAENRIKPFYKIPVQIQFSSSRGRIWFDATHLNFFVSNNLIGTGALSSFFSNESAPFKGENITFGNFNELDDLELNSESGFDITQFFDLGERLDTTWGAYFRLRELWADPTTNYGKGASLFTIIPFLSLNLTEIIDLNAITFQNSTTDEDIQIPNMGWNNFSTADLIPPTSFLANTLGNYSFNSEIQTTNYISHDLLQFFDGLVLNDPEQGFLDREIDDVASWVKEGGTLYVWPEDKYHNNLTSLNDLLATFSLEIAEETFYPYDYYKNFPEEDGYYYLELQDKINKAQLFSRGGSNIKTLALRDPLEIRSLDGENRTVIMGRGFEEKGVIGVSFYGKGKVVVVGDHDMFKAPLLDIADNIAFTQQLLRWGMQDYYDIEITNTPAVLQKGDEGFLNIQIKNYDEINDKDLLGKGTLFVGAFFHESGTLINGSLYGISTPILPVFQKDEGSYAIWLDSDWYSEIGSWYIMLVLDNPAGVSEIIYVKFEVVEGPAKEPIQYFQQLTPAYPHYIDIIGIFSIVFMGLILWYYETQKYKTRLKITQLQGDFLNIAKTKLNEVKTQLKLLLRGVEKEEVEEIERIRFLLSNQKRLMKFFKDLKKFGERIGEHY